MVWVGSTLSMMVVIVVAVAVVVGGSRCGFEFVI